MFKDNGRYKPALEEEVASLKGKSLQCPECGEYCVMAHVQFADTKCGKCGAQLVDAAMSTASKTTGS
jgi:ribosomal protein S27AE